MRSPSSFHSRETLWQKLHFTLEEAAEDIDDERSLLGESYDTQEDA